ncbi:MAG: HD-GYP domain-containing protein [Chloroflexi bacterium]|nr:HD-GYP domain-containing protein [Chloroflexota bacterium]
MGVWGIAVFLAPVLMTLLSFKQYVDKTTGNVLELRRTNKDLEQAHIETTQAMEQLGRAYEGTLRSLASALDARDTETGGHSARVAALTMAVAEEMGMVRDSDEWRTLERGALLHDVGKIAVPDHILRKPAALDPDEWDIMRKHPLAGFEILRSVEFLRDAADIVLAHHENFDGSGYPAGLAGESIPLGARIFAVGDAFDAMTQDRPYRKGRPTEEALAEILRCSGSQFDPQAVSAFLSVYRKKFVREDSSLPNLSESVKEAILEAAGMESN